MSARALLDPKTIDELAFVDRLEKLESEYESKYGRSPLNLSHWDASPEFLTKLSQVLTIPPLGEPRSYRYSYGLPHHEAVLAKLGYGDRPTSLLVCENGTSASLAAANWLALQGVSTVAVIAPRYF